VVTIVIVTRNYRKCIMLIFVTDFYSLKLDLYYYCNCYFAQCCNCCVTMAAVHILVSITEYILVAMANKVLL
jgi:hypothetical protein